MDHKNLQDIFTNLVLSLCYPRWNEIDYDLEKVLSLGEAKVMVDALSKGELS